MRGRISYAEGNAFKEDLRLSYIREAYGDFLFVRGGRHEAKGQYALVVAGLDGLVTEGVPAKGASLIWQAHDLASRSFTRRSLT